MLMWKATYTVNYREDGTAFVTITELEFWYGK